MASVPRNLANHPTHVVLDLDCTRSSGSRAAIKRFQKHALYSGITTEFLAVAISPFVCANSETEVWQHLHSLPVDVLETGDVPVLFPPLSDEEFGYDFWARSKKETQLHVQLLACTLLQPNIRIFHNWTHCVRQVVLRTSPNRASDLLTRRDM